MERLRRDRVLGWGNFGLGPAFDLAPTPRRDLLVPLAGEPALGSQLKKDGWRLPDLGQVGHGPGGQALQDGQGVDTCLGQTILVSGRFALVRAALYQSVFLETLEPLGTILVWTLPTNW